MVATHSSLERAAHVSIQDETLREGLQSPAVREPSPAGRLELLGRIERLGIEHLSVGLPAAGPRALAACVESCREIERGGLRVRPNAGGRTVPGDVAAIAEVAQRSGAAVDAFLFVGGSPIRQYVEGWGIEDLLARTRETVGMARREGLEVTFITEDTTRSSPEHLRALLLAAIEAGAGRVCLCDTVGHATPRGTRRLIAWVRALLAEHAPGVGIDWHGHEDRGLATANALEAAAAGADRIHATALGLGERAGNTPTEALLANLGALGRRRGGFDAEALFDYARTAAAVLGVDPAPALARVEWLVEATMASREGVG